MSNSKHKQDTRLSRRHFLHMAALTAGSVALSACAAPAGQPAGGDGAAAPAAAPVELRWWVNPFTDDDIANLWEPIIDDFYAAGNENIQIETEIMPWSDRRQKMMTSFAGGRAADVSCLNVDMVWSFAGEGALAPIGEYIDSEITTDTPQALQELCYLDGDLFMIPYNTGPAGRLYNVDLLAESGWTRETPPQTWDDFLELGPLAKDAGYYSTLVTVDQGDWHVVLWQNNGRILQEDEAGNVVGSAIDSDAVRETWTYLKELYESGYSPIEFVTMTVSAQMPDYFLNGQMVFSDMYNVQGASLAVEQAGEALNWAVLSPPMSKERPATGASDGSVGMFSSCENPSEAGQWLSFILSPDVMAEWANIGGYIPSRESARASEVWQPSDLVRTFGELAPHVGTNKDRYFFFQPGYQITNPEMQAFILGDKSLEDAIATAHASLNQLIEEGA